VAVAFLYHVPFAEAGACHPASRRAGFGRFMAEPSASRPDDASRAPGGGVTAEDANQRIADGQLMRRAAGGDEAAFAIFYRRFAPGVYSMIHQILQDPKECEDVMQEAFVQMWKKASTYDPNRSGLFTWAVMISRNKAIDRVRSRQRKARTIEAATEEAEVVTPMAVDSADELLEQSDQRKRVRAALSTLSGAQRDAIDLAFFGGMTQLEISDKLGQPLGTVKARIRRGLLALRGVLEARSS
jgi:RNA polymerase sigma-70 factor (ECF subfamily)